MVKGDIQSSNPTATPGCSDQACMACMLEKGKGGFCRRGNINYELDCHLCPDTDRTLYIGKTSRTCSLDMLKKNSFKIAHVL